MNNKYSDECLKDYLYAKADEADYSSRIEELKVQAREAKRMCVTSTALFGKTKYQSDLSDYMENLEELTNEYFRRKSAAIKRQLSILKIIDNVEDKSERRVLMLHYIDGKNYEDIAAIMAYGIDNIYRLRKNAIRELADKGLL